MYISRKLLHHIHQKHNTKLVISGAKLETNDCENFRQWGNNQGCVFSSDMSPTRI